MKSSAAEQGFSLLEILVALVIIGLTIASATKYFGDVFLHQSNERIVDARDQIVDRVRSDIANPDVLANSVALGTGAAGFEGNTAMSDCLDPRKICTVTRPQAQVAFQLVRQRIQGAGFTTEKIAGTTAVPQFYNLLGVRSNCNPSRSCPFAARAFFWATCPVPAASPAGAAPLTCAGAETIHVRFQVSQSYDPSFIAPTARAEASLRFASIPPGVPGQSPNSFTDNPAEYSFAVSAKDIKLRLARDCKSRDPNSFQAGVDKGGNPICNCTTSEIANSRAGDPLKLNRPTCTGNSCKGNLGQIMVGLKVNAATGASEPICVAPRECCWSGPFADGGGPDRKGGQGPGFTSGADCGLGGRMVDIKYGFCEVARRKKDTQDMFSYCGNSRVTCCRDVMVFDPSPATISVCGALP